MKKTSLRGSLVKKIVRNILLQCMAETPDTATVILQNKLNELLNFKTMVSKIVLVESHPSLFKGSVTFERGNDEYAIIDFHAELDPVTV